MADLKKKTPLYKVGDKVRTVTGLVGLVSEVHGTFSPTGHTHYRVYVPMDAEPLWVEVREDEVEKV
jgi:preprotein translocase subunit YajC